MQQIIFCSFLVILIFLLLSINLMFSEKSGTNLNKQIWFESGIENKFSSRISFSISFFLICLIFIMFDIEIIILFNYVFKYPLWFLLNYVFQVWFIFMFLYYTLVFEWKIGSISWKY